ncbi:MAG: signal peptidase I [Actinoplanes sp.]
MRRRPLDAPLPAGFQIVATGRGERARAALAEVVMGLRQAVLTCVAGMLLLSVAPAVLGWVPTVVVSGSMLPGIRPGDVVTAVPTDRKQVPRGTVVLVDDPVRPDDLLLHRLVDYDAAGNMITKGDANAARDSTPVPADSLRGVARMRVPYIGLPYFWFREHRYVPVVATVVLLLALILWHPRPRRVVAMKTNGPGGRKATGTASEVPITASTPRRR